MHNMIVAISICLSSQYGYAGAHSCRSPRYDNVMRNECKM